MPQSAEKFLPSTLTKAGCAAGSPAPVRLATPLARLLRRSVVHGRQP